MIFGTFYTNEYTKNKKKTMMVKVPFLFKAKRSPRFDCYISMNYYDRFDILKYAHTYNGLGCRLFDLINQKMPN